MKLLPVLAVVLLAAVSPAHADRSFSGATSVEEIDRRLAKIPEDRSLRKRAALLSDRATFLYKAGQMREAAATYEEALSNRPRRRLRRHIYLYLGKAYESHGRVDKAIAAYEEALAYDPDNWRRHRDLAGLYEQVKLYDKARILHTSARRLAPREPSLWYVSGRVYRKMGLYLEAEPFIEKAGELGHDENVVSRERSLLREGRGRYGDALEAWILGAGESNEPADIARTVYLASLAGNETIARDDLRRLKEAGASKETLNLYENLIQLAPSGPELDALVTSFLSRSSAPASDRTP